MFRLRTLSSVARRSGGIIPGTAYHGLTAPARAFSSHMDTSNLTSTQLEVREAIQKICSDFPDVRLPYSPSVHSFANSKSRTIGLPAMSTKSIPVNFTPPLQKMAGSVSLSRKTSAVQASEFLKPQ